MEARRRFCHPLMRCIFSSINFSIRSVSHAERYARNGEGFCRFDLKEAADCQRVSPSSRTRELMGLIDAYTHGRQSEISCIAVEVSPHQLYIVLVPLESMTWFDRARGSFLSLSWHMEGWKGLGFLHRYWEHLPCSGWRGGRRRLWIMALLDGLYNDITRSITGQVKRPVGIHQTKEYRVYILVCSSFSRRTSTSLIHFHVHLLVKKRRSDTSSSPRLRSRRSRLPCPSWR